MLMIFGANGDSGRELVKLCKNEALVAALRCPAEDDFFADVPHAVADVLDAAATEQIIAQHQPDVIVSFVGGKNEQGVRSDAVGNINIIQAACKHTPDARLVLITSMGCGEQWDGTSEMFRQALGEAVLAKTEAENVLRNSSLKWTIVRPCGLGKGEDAAYQIHENLSEIPRSYMNRVGLAAAVAHIVRTDGHDGKVYSVTGA